MFLDLAKQDVTHVQDADIVLARQDTPLTAEQIFTITVVAIRHA